MPEEEKNEESVGLEELQETFKEGEAAFTTEGFRRFAELMVEDDTTPELLKERFWAAPTKDAILSKLTREDISRAMLEFDDAVTAYLMSLPSGAYSFADEFQLTQLRLKFFLKLKRSEEGFERKMLATQIKQQVYEEIEQPKGGLLTGLRRFFTGGR